MPTFIRDIRHGNRNCNCSPAKESISQSKYQSMNKSIILVPTFLHQRLQVRELRLYIVVLQRNQSVKVSINQSINQQINHPCANISPSVTPGKGTEIEHCSPAKESISQSINQSINQQINHPCANISPSVTPGMGTEIEHCSPAKESISQTIDQSTNELINQSIILVPTFHHERL